MREEIQGTYEQGYADGRAYYTNDIEKQLFNVKTAMKVIQEYCDSEDGEVVYRELIDVENVLYVILEKSKKAY